MFPPHFSRTHFSIGVEHDFKNFFTKANKAYTEDNVLVYNVFVYDIPIQLTENDVRNYFSKFGKVLDVKLATDKTKSGRAAFKKAFVKFAEPESACSVLLRKHRSQGIHIRVKAGYSWEQPNADKVFSPKRFEYDLTSTSNDSWKDATATNVGTHMFSLNDDCIEHIFRYLKLKEQVRFARVCKRFKDIFQMYYRHQYKNFNLNNILEMSLWEIRDFFRLVGGNMTSLTGTVPFTKRKIIVEFIRQYCDKLKRIRLDRSALRIEYLDEFLRGYPQLGELTLRKCYLKDNIMQAITHLNILEILDLAENVKLTGKFIRNLVQLKVLNLYGCYNVQTRHLIDICQSLTNLRSLDIRECELLSETAFDAMVEHCKQLEILKLSFTAFPYDRVALLPRLKQLELVCFTLEGTIQQRLLAELVAHKVDQLEVLKIVAMNKLRTAHFALISELRQLKTLVVPYTHVKHDSLIKLCKLQQLEDLTIQGCTNITNGSLLKLVKSCPRLRLLDIQFCKEITIEFVLEAISFLRTSEKRKQPLVLLACGSVEDYHDTVVGKSKCKLDMELKEAAEQSLLSLIFSVSNRDLGFANDADFSDHDDDVGV